MQQGFFATMHGGRAWLAIIVVKLAIVVAVLVLLWQANAFFSLGIPVLLLHVGALAAIAGLWLWQSAHRSMAVEAHKPASHQSKTPHIGIILHSAALYDMLAWFLTYGRERAFREKMLGFANLKPGEAVLDIGCGTGTVALLAKTKVGPEGRVDGLDASPEMVARATAKARRTGLNVNFSNATAQQLPYNDEEFDLVLSTLMLHHRPEAGRPPARHRLCKAAPEELLSIPSARPCRSGQGSSRSRPAWIQNCRARRCRNQGAPLPARQAGPRRCRPFGHEWSDPLRVG
jgi:Methyltransferase domain